MYLSDLMLRELSPSAAPMVCVRILALGIKVRRNHVTISTHKAHRSAFVLVAAAFVSLIPAMLAQRYSPVASPDSQEAQFIDLIGLQSDESKRLALIEQFTQRFPKHQAVSWAYEQLQLSA